MTPDKEPRHSVEELGQLLDNYRQVADRLFISQKAKIEGRITDYADVLPNSVVLNRDIIQASNAEEVATAINHAIDIGYHPGVRTCTHPQMPSSPWVMGLKSADDTKRFMADTYSSWLNLPNLTEIIVMHNPKNLGVKEYEGQHFVFRLVHEDGGLYLEGRLQTSQLRSIEADINRDDLIRARVGRNRLTFENVDVEIGANYNQGRQYQMAVDNTQFLQGSLSANGGGKSAKVVEGILQRIDMLFVDPNIKLGEKLEAFAQQGLEISEWQGGMNDGGVEWMRIYGFRGSADDTNWTR